MATSKIVQWGNGATGVTSATGYSDAAYAPYPTKTLQAFLKTGTQATGVVWGSIDGNVRHQLGTLTLSGTNGEDAYTGVSAYNYLFLDITGITGSTVEAFARST
jgi:hypothetical protein